MKIDMSDWDVIEAYMGHIHGTVLCTILPGIKNNEAKIARFSLKLSSEALIRASKTSKPPKPHN